MIFALMPTHKANAWSFSSQSPTPTTVILGAATFVGLGTFYSCKLGYRKLNGCITRPKQNQPVFITTEPVDIQSQIRFEKPQDRIKFEKYNNSENPDLHSSEDLYNRVSQLISNVTSVANEFKTNIQDCSQRLEKFNSQF